MEFLGYFFLWAVSMVGGVLWHGYVLSVLWGWFIVPTFGAPALNVPQAIGLSCVIAFVKAKMETQKDERSWRDKVAMGIVYVFLGPLFSLGFGAIVKHWL